MQNLDQLRAAHAIREAKNTVKAAVSKLPAMILTNGLIAAIAFAAEADKPKRAALKAASKSIALHVARPEIGIQELVGLKTPEELLARLSSSSAFTLQRTTTEALAYLGYLKRYAPKGDDQEDVAN